MNSLIVSLFFRPIWPGHGTRIPQMFADSMPQDDSVLVLTGKLPKKIRSDSIPTNSEYGNSNTEIRHLWIPNIRYGTFFGKFLINSTFFIQCFFHVLFSKKIDLVLCFVPYLPFFGLVLIPAKMRKMRSIVVHADAWPEVLKDLGVVKSNIAYRVASKICISTITLSSRIVTFTDELKELLLKHGIDKDKIIVVNQGIDTQIFKSRRVEKNDRKFRVIYTGSFSPLYDFSVILKSAQKLKTHSDIIFELIGDGELKEEIKDYVKANTPDNVTVLDSIKDSDKLIEKINSADAGIIGINNNVQNNSTHPNKILEYLSCGLPILCSAADGAPKELIEESKGGIVVDNHDSDALSKMLLEIYENPARRETMSENAQSYIEKNHSLQVFKRQFCKILQS